MDEEKEVKEMTVEVKEVTMEVKEGKEMVIKAGDLSWVNTFEDLLEVVGICGRWNILTFIMCAAMYFISPLQGLSYQFLGATPDYWCHVAPLVEANWTDHQILSLAIPYSNSTGKYEGCKMHDYNYTTAALLGYEATMKDASQVKLSNTTVTCPARNFNHSQYTSTVVTEWDLVCDRRALYSTTQAVLQAGNLVGYILFGYLIDVIGRRPVLLGCSVLYILAGLLTIASPTVGVYMLMKVAIATVGTGAYLSIFVFVMETCSVKYRAAAGTMVVIPWALGYMAVPGIAYLVRPWKWLQFAFTLPALYCIIYFWLLPESPRWLITQGRFEEALKVITKIAKVNRKPLPSDSNVIAAMENIAQQDSRGKGKDESDKEATFWSRLVAAIRQLFVLMINPQIRMRSLIMFFCWFAAAMVYYGVALNSNNLSTDPYMYTFLGGLLEVPSYLLLWLALVFIGRKKVLVALYFTCGVCIFLVMTLMLASNGGAEGYMVFFSQTGKVAVTAAFQLVWMYTAELFPTNYRSLAIGQTSFIARFGSAASPYINDILGEYTVWAPSALFGSVSLVSAVLAFFLPETKNCNMPESADFFSKDTEAREGPKGTALEDVTQGVVNQSYAPDPPELGQMEEAKAK